VIYRPKTGFGVPLRHWLQTILKPLVDDVLCEASINSRGVFNSKEVALLRQRDRAGQVDATYTIFSMVCLELWCRQFIDHQFVIDPII
jgi:asparagine synthase (glutamine-hydrolysing)